MTQTYVEKSERTEAEPEVEPLPVTDEEARQKKLAEIDAVIEGLDDLLDEGTHSEQMERQRYASMLKGWARSQSAFKTYSDSEIAQELEDGLLDLGCFC